MADSNQTQRAILDSALTLFSAKGYEGVSVSELTGAASVTKPTLYYHFGNKEGTFGAVCQQGYTKLNEVVAEAVQYSPDPKHYERDVYQTLSNLIAAYFKFARQHEAFYRLAMSNLYMHRSSPVFAIVERYHFTQYELVEQMFNQMAQAHPNLAGKARQLAWSLIGEINSFVGLMLSSSSGESGKARQKVTDSSPQVTELVRQFMHGIYV